MEIGNERALYTLEPLSDPVHAQTPASHEDEESADREAEEVVA